MDVLATIAEYGAWFYAVTFAWTFVEGETFVIFAGLAAHEHLLRLDLLIASAWLGSFLGDQLYFFIGRRYGVRLLARFPRLRPGVESALDWLRRYNTWFILSFRFVYLVRNMASFAMGMSGVAWRRFVVLNFIAAGVWATTFAGAGYLFGAAFEHLIGDAAEAFMIAMATLFALAVGFTVTMERRRRRLASGNGRAAGLRSS